MFHLVLFWVGPTKLRSYRPRTSGEFEGVSPSRPERAERSRQNPYVGWGFGRVLFYVTMLVFVALERDVESSAPALVWAAEPVFSYYGRDVDSAAPALVCASMLVLCLREAGFSYPGKGRQ